jgi:hypothetical protein
MSDPDDHRRLEQAALEVLTRISLRFARLLEKQLAVETPEFKEFLIELVWTFSSFAQGVQLRKGSAGRAEECRLGLFTPGSASAFEEPFIADEFVPFSGHLALHEYVHDAVERALLEFSRNPT